MAYKEVEDRKAYDRAYHQANRAQVRAKQKEWYEANKDHVARWKWVERFADPRKTRSRNLKRAYGLTYDQWEDLFESQCQRCACCGSTDPDNKLGWHTDHDHPTGKVRGIVCYPCNHMLAHTSTPERLAQGIEYLKRHSETHLAEMLG